MKITRDYLEKIINSTETTDVIFNELWNAAKIAQKAGMSQGDAIRLFGELGGDGSTISKELDSCISSVFEIVAGHCAPEVRLWEDIWDNTKE